MNEEAPANDDDSNLYEKAKGEGEDKVTSQLLQQTSDDPISGPEKKCVQPGGLKVIIIGSIIFALGVTVALIIDIYTGEHNVGHGSVSSDTKNCSEIGLDILKKGGSAVDAAIATSLCVGVVCPESTGIGGGGFMLIQSPEGDMKVIDFREVAPSAASKNMFVKDKNSSRYGGLAVAVPGQIRGFEVAHQKYGKLKWSELFSRVIDLARNGFPIQNSTKKWLHNSTVRDKFQGELKPLFKEKNGLIHRRNLSKTLEQISKKGSKGFYFGDIAKSIVKTVTDANGILTLEDLQTYTVKVREPVSTDYGNYRIFSSGPPSSGLVLLSAMNILEGFNLSKADRNDSLAYHYLVEYCSVLREIPKQAEIVDISYNANREQWELIGTLKFVYAQRTRLADPDFESLKNITEAMLSKQEAKLLRKQINKKRTYNNASHYGPFFEAPPNKGTSHVTVMDRKGGVVSVTSTINGIFGSMLLTPTGILLNNEMDDFSTPGVSNMFEIKPSEANFIVPGKRPLSSICPVIALDKSNLCSHQVVLGGSGGSRITSGVIQVLLNILSFERNLEEAIEWPRLHHQLLPMVLEVEETKFLEKQLGNIPMFLKKQGNKLNETPSHHAIVNGGLKQGGRLYGHADSRRGNNGGGAVY